MLDEGFFLPAASKTAHHQLKEAARQLVHSYVTDYDGDLRRVWETERPFELHLPTAIISGRADVILDVQDGELRSLAIVDYKTSADPAAGDDYALRLAIYADAGRREGLPIEAAYIHDLKAADRQPIDVSPAAITASEPTVESSVADLRRASSTPALAHAAVAASSTTSVAGTRASACEPRRIESCRYPQSRACGARLGSGPSTGHLASSASFSLLRVQQSNIRFVGNRRIPHYKKTSKQRSSIAITRQGAKVHPALAHRAVAQLVILGRRWQRSR
jgi:PD-(D/E)XK nuclease superfamily